VPLQFKFDEKLFRKYTRHAESRLLLECLFADDGALLASTREGMARSVREYQDTSSRFGLTVSLQKTKAMATGRCVTAEDKEPVTVDGGVIESVEVFPYLGSLIATSGRVNMEEWRRPLKHLVL